MPDEELLEPGRFGELLQVRHQGLGLGRQSGLIPDDGHAAVTIVDRDLVVLEVAPGERSLLTRRRERGLRFSPAFRASAASSASIDEVSSVHSRIAPTKPPD